ncbi:MULTISPECIES: ester cyclase [Thermomonosporaceae]|uniref:ester cyclase n=1 Tax=Thermomonosporaceae TaxID=2012 RepID=UPI00255ACB31|nr:MULTISPECIES: ester cyclase [Thermomonosporaceae]MDL4774095.1 ester cyclase [Actinomadura xylanilytica]
MSAGEAGRELARRWLVEGWCGGDLDLADRIFAPDLVLRGRRVGPAGPRDAARRIRASFAGMTVDVGLQVAEGERVVTYFTARGRHVAGYRGIPPTGRTASASGIQIWTFRDGLVVADVNVFDEWGLVSQLR